MRCLLKLWNQTSFLLSKHLSWSPLLNHFVKFRALFEFILYGIMKDWTLKWRDLNSSHAMLWLKSHYESLFSELLCDLLLFTKKFMVQVTRLYNYYGLTYTVLIRTTGSVVIMSHCFQIYVCHKVYLKQNQKGWKPRVQNVTLKLLWV